MKGVMRSVKKSDLEKIAIRNCEQLMRECKYQTKLVSYAESFWPLHRVNILHLFCFLISTCVIRVIYYRLNHLLGML